LHSTEQAERIKEAEDYEKYLDSRPPFVNAVDKGAKSHFRVALDQHASVCAICVLVGLGVWHSACVLVRVRRIPLSIQ
jgi:hypothetical protein